MLTGIIFLCGIGFCLFMALASWGRENNQAGISWLIGAGLLFLTGAHVAHPETCVTDDVSGYVACTSNDND